MPKAGRNKPHHDYALVAGRIEALVREGRLVAQGDIKKWRLSEVRQP